MHISSLPGSPGVGGLGAAARRFADFLSEAGFSLWQVLPISPVSSVLGNSPYSSPSAFAGNRLFISAGDLSDEGLCSDSDIGYADSSSAADYSAAEQCADVCLSAAWENFISSRDEFSELREDFLRFKGEESFWLRDYVLFSLLKEKFGGKCWTEWPDLFRAHDESALVSFASEEHNSSRMDYLAFVQFLFFRQWRKLKDYCHIKGVSLIGDIPMFVAPDSSDVWANRNIFQLDGAGRPLCVAGVPPDYFSETGQRWGNPLYRWENMESDNFLWWRRRIESSLKLFDMVRIDHFRGFEAYWSIPESELTAVNGEWVSASGEKLLSAVKENICAGDEKLPLIAEDLGIITDGVRALMNKFGLPGMKVLLFAFGSDVADNPYAPHNMCKNAVVYTGTHDNNTVWGWWREETSAAERLRFRHYAGESGEFDAAFRMAHLALSSVADTAVVPMQDILGLGSDCRMNTPGVGAGNWKWRMTNDEFMGILEKRSPIVIKYRELNVLFGRVNKVF